MNISSVCIQNFRKLYQCHIDFSNDTTLFVGANNSGKTSAMDALGKFLAGRPFAFNDITISNRELINQIGKQWETVACEKPNSLSEWGNLLPSLDVWLNVNPQDIHYVVGIIPTLKWRGGRLGVRLIYQPRKIEGLFTEYREAFFSARETEKAGAAEKKIRLFPNSLCEYLERYFTSSFVVKSYILDPEKFDADSPQETAFGMECLVDNPLTGIIRIDTIGAQRNLSDPEKHDGTDSDRTRLSTKIRSYYDKYLDPEKTPLPEDLEILAATEQARKIFDNNLENKFKPAIKELEELGYPGIANPRITITSKVTTTEMLRHDSAVQYSLGEKGDGLILPEKYNGLGYQNLISIVFDLISYRDGWMRAGKSGTKDEIIEPLHLVLVEEPEAHLHVQVCYQNKEIEALSRTFEDSLIYSNWDTFKGMSVSDPGQLIKKLKEGLDNEDSFETIKSKIFESLKQSDVKAEFALDLIYSIDPNMMVVPQYIDKGLKWLEDLLCEEG